MVTDRNAREPGPTRLGRYVWGLVAAWTGVVAASLAWNLHQEKAETLEVARSHARTAYQKDLIYRRWASQQGGVYVPVDKTPPNPYLDVPDREISTPSGKRLTLVNPAYMVRLVYKLEAETYGVRSHIVALNPVNPANAADPWEAAALEAFQRGHTEVSSVEQGAGKAHMRMMRPLETEKSCLECHEQDGYALGDVRGGISVSVPLEPLQVAARKHMLTLSAGHALLWLLGVAGIGVGARHLRKQMDQRQRAEQALNEAEIRLRTLAERKARRRAEESLMVTKQKLLMARKIQQDLFPAKAPVLPGFDVGGVACPAEATSGDYFDYVPMPDGCLGIVIADVSGHGIGPALRMMETRAYLRALAQTCADVGDVLTKLNAFLSEDATHGHFVTVFLARLDPRSRSFVYASAGHRSYLLDPTGDVRTLDATALPLGLSPDVVVPAAEPMTLEPGQLVLFLTDGITEAATAEGSPFGSQRAIKVVHANHDKSAAECADRLYRATVDFCQGVSQRDDMTAVVLKVECSASPASLSQTHNWKVETASQEPHVSASSRLRQPAADRRLT